MNFKTPHILNNYFEMQIHLPKSIYLSYNGDGELKGYFQISNDTQQDGNFEINCGLDYVEIGPKQATLKPGQKSNIAITIASNDAAKFIGISTYDLQIIQTVEKVRKEKQTITLFSPRQKLEKLEEREEVQEVQEIQEQKDPEKISKLEEPQSCKSATIIAIIILIALVLLIIAVIIKLTLPSGYFGLWAKKEKKWWSWTTEEPNWWDF